MKIVLLGAGHIGQSIAHHLTHSGHYQLVVVDQHNQALQPVAECVAQSKGKEYMHVLLPWLEQGEFPAEGGVTQEEENLFYVAVTRAQQQLSLIVPRDTLMQSPFVARMGLEQVNDRAYEALRLNQQRHQAQPYQAVTRPPAAPSFREPVQQRDGRVVLAVPYAQKDEAKALGAMWDPAGRVWYVPAGKDVKPFEHWLPKN